ncbi:MAG TPA: hypothetical protein VLF91_02910 [Candidatus Saccharimonadales bacterium]|nr:hypothetical protein [Candidatus Saccharimonadales bacterium]
MNAKRLFYVLIGAICLVIGLGGLGVVGGNKFLGTQSDVLLNLRLESESLDAQQTAVAQAQSDIIKYDSLNKIALSVVPEEKDQAQTVRELVELASNAGVSLGSISFPTSSLGGKTAGNVPSQLTPVKGISGVYEMPITIQSDPKKPITFPQLVSFLQSLENNRHTAQVGQVTITPADSGGGGLTFELIVNVYIKP